VLKVSPHGKLPVPNADDYDNINPITYDGEFYQEQHDDEGFDILLGGIEALKDNAQNYGEGVVNLKDIDMLSKLHLDDDKPPPPSPDGQPSYVRDSDDETPLDYNNDDSYGF
jgi:hypothetical protein